MKKFGTKIVSLILVFSLIFTGASAMGNAAAADVEKTLTRVGVSIVDVIISGLLNVINFVVPDSKEFKKVAEHTLENFYDGTDTMLEEPAENAAWKLGYAKASLVPSDWQEKDYYLGGFISIENGMSNKVEEVIDDMMVRVIALDDGSGRGTSVFATIDAIGVSNGDIKEIRKALVKTLKDDNINVELNSINVASTHVHSAIDTQGLWTNLLPKVLKNLVLSFLPIAEKDAGVDTEYMEFLYAEVAKAMKAAINDMTEGKMTFATKKLNPKYFSNKNRKSASALINDMSRFVFTPFDTSKLPTMIVSIAAHPDVAGLAVDEVDNGRDLSGDYVYYMGEEIEKNDYNFMFFNGAIAGIYEGRGETNDGVSMERRYEQSERFGIEMARCALNLTNSKEEILANMTEEEKALEKAEKEEGGEGYTPWYMDWSEETGYTDWKAVTERELAPVLNIKLTEAKIRVTNPLIKFVGKLNLVNYTVYKDGLEYYIFAEIGYMEMGDVKIAMMPGEIVQDLVAGGSSLTADGSYTGKDFGYKSIYELFGEDTVCFGLMNDAIGYVVPDNDYSMAILDDHYQELISLGKYAASSIMRKFAVLAEEVK